MGFMWIVHLEAQDIANIYFQNCRIKESCYAFDQDETAIENAKVKLSQYANRVILIQSNFKYLKEELMLMELKK